MWAKLGQFLPDWRLFPAFVALGLYPFVSHVPVVLAVLAAVVLVSVGGWLNHRMLFEGRIGVIAAGAFLLGFALFCVALAAAWEDAWVETGTLSGVAFRFALGGMLAAGSVLGVRIALGKAGNVAGVAFSGAGLGLIVGLSAFLGLLPFLWEAVDQLAVWLHLDGAGGLAFNLLVFATAGAALFWRTVELERPEIVKSLDGGLAPAAAGVALVLPALFLLAAVADSRGVDPGRDPPQYARGVFPTAQPSTLTPHELAERYRPVFLIDRNEQWPIESVDGYLGDATVRRIGRPDDAPVATHPRPEDLPRSCAAPDNENGAREPICYVISAGCPDVITVCDHRAGPWTQHTVPAGAVYARVLRLHEPSTDGTDVFRAPVPYDGLTALIQYWIFYRNDLWRASTAIGRVVQRHEADWEYVTVGLGDRAPLFVAYSAHCGGEVVPWDRVRTSGRGGIVRPVVWVARGSHANYPGPDPRTPDFTSCPRASRPVKFLLTQLAFAANVREVLPDALVHQDPRVVEPVDAHYPAFSVPARWAPNDGLRIENVFHDAALPRSPQSKPSGPETPTCKAEWKDPLAILACSKYWGDRSRCTPELEQRYSKPQTGCV